MPTCKQFNEFLKELTELKKEFSCEEEPESELAQASKTGNKGIKLGSLLDNFDSDDDSIFDLEDDFKQAEDQLIPMNATKSDLTMCCC